MKRISLLVALAILLAVAAPVMAGPYSDVPENHWAYEALNKLAPTGIMGGYPDGTFKGNDTLNRFQIAVIVSRILDQVAAERALMTEKVDALENGLTAGQAEDVIAIFKSLLAKYDAENAKKEPVVVTPPTTDAPVVVAPVVEDKLMEKQAAEVAAIVEALTLEFSFELEAMGAKIDALGTRIDGVEARVAKLEETKFNGKYSVTVRNNKIVKNNASTKAFYDPFKLDYDGDETYNEFGDATYDSSDYYIPFNRIENKVTVGVDVKKGDLTADLDIVAFRDRMDSAYTNTGAYDNWFFMNGVVTSGDFNATIGHDQEMTMKSYLFNNGDTYNGVVVNVGDNQYAFLKYKVEDNYDPTDLWDNDGTDEDADEVTNPDKVVLPAENMLLVKQQLGLLDSTLFFGTKDLFTSNEYVAAISTPMDLLTIDFNTDVAAHQKNGETYKYITVDAKKTVGPLTVSGDYTVRDDNFKGIEAYGIRKAGYTGKADLNLFDGKVKANGRYKDYTDWAASAYDNNYGFGGEVAFGGLTAKYDKDFVIQEKMDNSWREQRSVDFTQKLGFLNLNAGYEYDKYVDKFYKEFVDENTGEKTGEDTGHYGSWTDADFSPYDIYNNVYGKVTADLFIPGLTATASYGYSLDKDDSYYVWVGNKEFSTHKYNVSFTKGIVSAGYTYDLAYERQEYTASLNPAEFNVFGFGIDTVAGVKVRDFNAAEKENLYNYNLGVDVKKALNDKSNFKYSFLYDNRELSGSNMIKGLQAKHVATVDYALTSDLKASATYTNLDFTGVDSANDYNVNELKGSLSFSF